MTTTAATKRQQQQAYADQVRRYASDPLAFAADLHVPLGGGIGRLGDAWADFQQRDFAALAPSLLAVARGDMAPTRRYWLERTKGASKDSDVAICVLWLLLFASRPIRIQIGAKDVEQASEIKFIAKAILSADALPNRLAATKIDVQKNSIIAHADTLGRTESVCEILTADAYGSHGSRPDVVIANELSHVTSEAFMQTLLDNADKVPHSIVIIATNAGEVGTWQENWRDIALASERWYTSIIDYPAPWVSAADLAESRQRNPAHRYNRLWRGVWSSGDGDGIDPADIAACTTLDKPPAYSQHHLYLMGVDLGLKNDRAAVAVLAADPMRGTVSLAAAKSWRPEDSGGEIDLNEVQQMIVTLTSCYGVGLVLADPWQAALMIQNLRNLGINACERAFVPKQKDLMARALLEAFRNRLIHLYDDAELIRDLHRLKIKEGPVGFRLDATRDDSGHADKAIAFAIALSPALHIARNYENEQMGQRQLAQRIIA